MFSPISICLLTDNSIARQQWSDWLPAPEFQILPFPTDSLAAWGLDLVVTDCVRVDLGSPLSLIFERQLETGVIAIGSSLPADVTLPADVGERELRLACTLLAKVVRLRREHWIGQQDQITLRQLALTDPLTGIPNRRAWDEELQRRIQEAKKRRENLCLALFDLDYFKQVNDGLSYTAGDEVLKVAAQALATTVRSDDFVARIGGDEFGLLMRNVSATSAAVIVERHQQVIAAILDEHRFGQGITASAGYAISLASQPETAEKLFAQADLALKGAKACNRKQAVTKVAQAKS